MNKDIFRHNLANKVFKLSEDEYKVFYKLCLKLGVNYGVNHIDNTEDISFNPDKNCFRICSNAYLLENGSLDYYRECGVKRHTFEEFKKLVEESKQGLKNPDKGKSFKLMCEKTRRAVMEEDGKIEVNKR